MFLEKKKDRPIKRMIGLLIPFILLISKETFADVDTTKSDTQLVPKENDNIEDVKIKNEEQNGDNAYRDDTDDDEDCNFLGCIIGGFFKFIFVEPFKVFFRPNIVDDFSEKKVKWGLGASILDFSLYPKASFSYSIKLNGDLLITPNEFISIREHIGMHLSPFGGFLSDFKRDIYVNGNIIGYEKDKGEYYYNFSFPLCTEVMYRPAGVYGSFFFLLGAGPRYVYEKFEGVREYSYQNTKDSIKVSDGNWIPSISFGIGKLMEIGGPFASFEIRYSLGINQNRKKISLSGDNTKFVHGFTVIQYQIFF